MQITQYSHAEGTNEARMDVVSREKGRAELMKTYAVRRVKTLSSEVIMQEYGAGL